MSGFSLRAYRSLLRTACDAGWRVVRYPEDGPPRSGEILLRHDVDYSVQLALEMARANAELGVRGTFFLLLQSDLYNLMSPPNLRAARAIHEAGQTLGLHFPMPKAGVDADLVIDLVLAELARMRDVLPVEQVFAWHNPTTDALSAFGELTAPGLINVYAPPFCVSTRYRSDSNLRNSPDDFSALLLGEDRSPLHLLFHPLNWVVGGRDMIEILRGAWAQVIREREHDFLTNCVYRDALPHGVPGHVIDRYAQDWEAAARTGGLALGGVER